MSDQWDFYLCRVNGALASILVDMGLRDDGPDVSKPWLLYAWVKFKRPRADGLSDASESDTLSSLEDALEALARNRLEAIPCGRITTSGRREFYYYAPRNQSIEGLISDLPSEFRAYEFECGTREDPLWGQYFDVLYPGPEDLQKIGNRHLIETLQKGGDDLIIPRDVRHWAYFGNESDRAQFAVALRALGYSTEFTDVAAPARGIEFSRHQAIDPDSMDEATVQLVRLARQLNGEYDGWETELISGSRNSAASATNDVEG